MKTNTSTEIVHARKNGMIHVDKISECAEIEVWSKNGNLETVEHVHVGDLVATRCDKAGKSVIDGFGHENSWKISREVLAKKYDFDANELEKFGKVVATPKGGIQTFKKLNEDTTFMKPWGPNGEMVPQKILAGGWANITDPADVYGIAAEEFEETYEVLNGMRAVEVITLSSIRYYKGYMPIGILTNSKGMEVGYLSPFRGYSFQVSATFEGHSDLGSTQVFGLNNLLDARFGTERNIGYQSNLRMDSVKLYMLELAAKEAVNKFCANSMSEVVYVFRDSKCERYLWHNEDDPERSEALPLLFGATMMQRFVALCAKWLNPELYNSWVDHINVAEDAQKSIDYHKVEATKEPHRVDYHNRRIEEIRKDFVEVVNMTNPLAVALLDSGNDDGITCDAKEAVV